ncbi:MAG: RNA pyrophosphohydrolase [Bdellovibrionota bacterium]
MSTQRPLEYRRNVAIIVLNEAGAILACHRADLPGAWQLPQGGIEPDESDDTAMLRELGEEIGTCEVTVIGKLPNPIRYDWPEHLFDRGYRGQEQSYYLVRLAPLAVMNLDTQTHREFCETEWVGAREFLRRASGFKGPAYARALEEFRKLFPGIIAE